MDESRAPSDRARACTAHVTSYRKSPDPLSDHDHDGATVTATTAGTHLRHCSGHGSGRGSRRAPDSRRADLLPSGRLRGAACPVRQTRGERWECRPSPGAGVIDWRGAGRWPSPCCPAPRTIQKQGGAVEAARPREAAGPAGHGWAPTGPAASRGHAVPDWLLASRGIVPARSILRYSVLRYGPRPLMLVSAGDDLSSGGRSVTAVPYGCVHAAAQALRAVEVRRLKRPKQTLMRTWTLHKFVAKRAQYSGSESLGFYSSPLSSRDPQGSGASPAR